VDALAVSHFDVEYTGETEMTHYAGKSKEAIEDAHHFYVHKKNKLRYMLLHFTPLELLKRIPYEVKDVLRCVVERKDGDNPGIVGNLALRDEPLRRLRNLSRVYWENLIALPEILEKRRHRDAKIERTV
jgi:hypothetical protein